MMPRPDPAVMRTSARGLLRAAEELEHDASTARESLNRLQHRWTGGASLQHASAVGDYVRGLGAAATGIRAAAQLTTATATQLERELIDLVRLERRCAALGASGPAACGADIEQVWSRIRAHQMLWVRAVDQVALTSDIGRRMRCGPARRPDLGVYPGPRMRCGPVRPPDLGQDPGRLMRTGPARRIAQAWPGGSGDRQIVAVHLSPAAS